MAPRAKKVPSNGLSKLKSLLEGFGVSALTSVIISGVVTFYFESRLENSKDHVAAINKQKEAFDASQIAIFGQLGLYANLVLSKDPSAKKDQLYSAIVASQLQLNRLRDEIKADKYDAISQYSKELDQLDAKLRDVKELNDLKPVYVSAQKILELHDKVSDEVRAKAQITLF